MVSQSTLAASATEDTDVPLSKVNRILKFALPVCIVLIAWGVTHYIKANKPEPVIRPSQVSLVVVNATRLQPTHYPVTIRSQGVVQPALANALVPEVAGTVTQLSDVFVVGGRFAQGDILLQIDPRDYQIAVTQAEANLAQTEAQLLEQQALAERARAEWRSMGRSGAPSALTLREPQLAAAKANRDAASAQLERSKLDLARTQLIAPYDGMVSERNVDRGQFVAKGTRVGQIYSVHALDVRLPLSNRQLTYLTLPEELSRDDSTGSSSTTPTTNTTPSGSSDNTLASTTTQNSTVELRASVGSTEYMWTGQLIRAEGVDTATQQLNLIAQIRNPLTQNTQPLRVGQFVQALVEGQVLEKVFVIPRSALREDREVLLIDDDQTIRRQAVTVAWSDDEVAAINEGIEAGALLITTSLSTVADGTPVRATIDGVAPAPLEKKGGTKKRQQRLD